MIKYVVAFLMGGITLFLFQKAILIVGEWRTIQVLRSTDKSHTAELQRLYGYIDVNFRIILDNKKIYSSPDFTPDYAKPFREWITWDETQRYILFYVADKPLFGYDIQTQEPVPEASLSMIPVPHFNLLQIGYEGKTPL